jgi:YD repeat-containing protein
MTMLKKVQSKGSIKVRRTCELGLILLLVCVAGSAQSASCDYGYVYQAYSGIPLTPGTYRCDPFAPYTLACYAKTNACTPVSAVQETSCGKCASASAGMPINLTNGNTFITHNDFAIPGLGGGISLSRVWNSKWPDSQAALITGRFGKNWRSTYEERLFFYQDGYLKYSRSDGSYWSFGYDPAAQRTIIIAPADVSATLTNSGSVDTVTFFDGSKRTFDQTSGWLKSIIDRNGNTTTLSYDTNNRLIQVIDPALRTVTFAYASPTSNLVSSVTSNAGTFTYDYDSESRLIKVTHPNNSFVTFEYDAQSLITAVKDSEGKLLEGHTYDSQNRGLSSTRANGVDAITVSYPATPSGIIVSNPD